MSEVRAEAARYLLEAVAAFRTGMEAQGHVALQALVDALLAGLEDPASGLRPEALGPLLEPVLAAQARGDTLFVADELEFELLPLLA